jgi:hypothetical protein
MTIEEQRKIVREQLAGYALLDRFNLEEERQMTFEDRLEALDSIMGFEPCLPPDDSRNDDDEVTQTWMKIRARYDAAQP